MADKQRGKLGAWRRKRSPIRNHTAESNVSAAVPPCVELLEARVLYSADVLAVFTEGSVADDDAPGALLLPNSQAGTLLELVFVNDDVSDVATLTADLQKQIDNGRRLQVHLLDSQSPGLDQMGQIIKDAESVAAIHVLSHGSTAGVQVGAQWLSDETVQQYREELASWQPSLLSQASLHIYGCDLAASDAGIDLLNALASYTGAEVLASDDKTGHTSLQADWDLEYSTGDKELVESLVSDATAALWLETLAAPALSDGALANINEDALVIPGDTIANIFTGQFSGDGNFSGIAIASDATTTEGVWQYSTDNGTNWYAIGAVTTDAALTLDTTSMLRFVPSADVNGAVPELTLYGIDDSYTGAFSVGGAAVSEDLSSRGGATPYAVSAATISSVINAVNDAPLLGDSSLIDIVKGDAAPDGQSVTEIFAGQFSDVDAGDSLGGVAVVADATVAEGIWEYSTDAGSNWYPVGVVSTNAALMLDNVSSLRFVPTEDYEGAVPQLTVHGVDSTGGPYTVGAAVIVEDLTARGGSSSYAQTAALVSSSVLPVFAAVDDALGSVLAGSSYTFPVSDLTDNDIYKEVNAPTILSYTNPSAGTLLFDGNEFDYSSPAMPGEVVTFDYRAKAGHPDLINQWELTADGSDDTNRNHGNVNSDSPPGALDFNGDDFVEIPQFSYSSEFTLAFDFKVGSFANDEEVLLAQGRWLNDNSLFVWITGEDESPARRLITDIRDDDGGGGSRSEIDVKDFNSDWYSYAITVQQGVGTTVYINGNEAYTSTRADGAFLPTEPLFVGAEDTGGGDMDYFLDNHDIRNLRYYDSALSQPELAELEVNTFDVATASVTVRNEEVLVNNNSIIVTEDTDEPISSGQLLTTDLEDGPASLTYTVLGVPAHGSVLLDGVPLSDGESFTQLDINSNKLQFRHGGSETATSDIVSLRVDDGAGSHTDFSFAVVLQPLNDAPVLDGIEFSALDYAEGDGEVSVSETLTLSDADDLQLQTATVSITSGYQAGEDTLVFTDTPAITSTFNSTTGILSLTGSTADIASWQLALRSVSFLNNSDDLTPGSRSVAFVVNEGDDNSGVQQRNIQVTAVNDSPSMGSASLPAIAEDSIDPPGDSLVNLFSSFNDVDGIFTGVAVTSGASRVEGDWQYSTDAGANWFDVGVISESSALTLPATAMLRFLPAVDFFGQAPELVLHAMDDSYANSLSVGAAREYTNVISSGSTGPYAVVPSEISTHVTAVGPSDLSSGITLNTDGGNDTYLLAGDGGAVLGGLDQVSIETRFSIESVNSINALVSYSAVPIDDTVKLLVRSNGQVDVGVMGVDVLSAPVPDLLDGLEHSLALTWDANGGLLRLYADGELIHSQDGVADGAVFQPGGTLVMGMELDSPAGGFETSEVLSGTLYDVRIWNDVRTGAEIRSGYAHKYYPENLPESLVANWQMDGVDSADSVVDVVDIVGGNNLTFGHVTETGFSASVPIKRLQVLEGAAAGTLVGNLATSFPYAGEDLIQDGSFTLSGDTVNSFYTAGNTIGGASGYWQVDRGDVELKAEWDTSPLGGFAIDLNGDTDGAISQTISTIPGEKYQLDFALSGNFRTDGQQMVRVIADGIATDLTVKEPDLWSQSNLIWEQRAITFIATSDNTVIGFEAVDPGNQGPLISDVRVQEYDARIDAVLAANPALIYNAGTGKFYQTDGTATDWVTAQSNASATELNGVGGRLVTILSDYENRIVRDIGDLMGTNFHLGATDQTSEGKWYWHTGTGDGELLLDVVDGSPPHGIYTNWKSGEPNNHLANNPLHGEDYVVMFKDQEDGLWNDEDIGEDYSSIFEWDVADVLDNVTYSIVSDPASAFTIDEKTGQITVVDTSGIDNETNPNYNITVRVTDVVGEYYEETVTILVIDNTAPQLSSIESTPIAYMENDTPVPVTSSIVVTDADNTELDSATIYVVGYSENEDLLEFTDFGSFTHFWDNANGILSINSTSPESVDEWKNALRSVTYRNTSDDPSSGTLDIDFVISDGAEVSNIVTRSVIVSEVNDAPVQGDGLLSNVKENDSAPSGQTINEIFGSQFTDVDGLLTGVAVVSDSTVAEGSWEFSTDSGGSWNAVGAVSEVAALILYKTDKLRFVPAADYYGDIPELGIVGIDDTYNAAGSVMDGARVIDDVTVRGSSTPFSDVPAGIATTVLINGPMDLSVGIELNNDGGNDAYLIADNGAAIVGGLSAITIEAQITFEQTVSGGFTPILSYATPANANTLLLAVEGDGTLFMHVNDTRIDSIVPVPIDGKRHAIAFTWDALHGEAIFYIDGEPVHREDGVETGSIIHSGGELVVGQDQDSPNGGYNPLQFFSGTYHDLRIFNEVRTEAEIAQTFQHIYPLDALPSSLIANWQMDRFDGSGVEIADVVGGSKLAVKHASGAGFVNSDPNDQLAVPEYSANGTVVGSVVPHSSPVVEDIVSDGLFTYSGDTGDVFAGETIGTGGPWLVTSGNINIEGDWLTPLGGKAIDLNGGNPGAISQTLVTEPGEVYQVSFALTGNFQGLNDKELAVGINSGSSITAQNYTVTPVDGWGAPADLMWGHRSLTFTADASATTLSFASIAPNTWYGALIGDVQVVKVPTAVADLLASDASLSYDAATNKIYKKVSSLEPFLSARDNAIATELNGVPGQLVTINSDYENSVVLSLAESIGNDIWLGASDAAVEGDWNWLKGMVPNDLFWVGSAAGSRMEGAFVNWGGVEPDDDGLGQDYAVMLQGVTGSNGIWYDDVEISSHSYVVEWDADAVLSAYTFNVISDPSGAFSIDGNTGQIMVSDGSSLDHETNSSHDITIRTQDAAGKVYDETLTIQVTNVPAPVLTDGNPVTVSYTENSSPVPIADLLLVADTDDVQLQSATLTIAGNFQSGEDVLSFTDTGTLSHVWNSATGVLVISGPDNVAAWQNALRAVTYHNTSEAPTESTRTVEIVISDDNEISNVITRNIEVISINDSPAIVNGVLTDAIEDSDAHTGQTVAEIFAGSLSDDDGSVVGVVIAGNATIDEGVWEYSTDNGANWYNVGSDVNSSPLVLSLATKLRFVPESNYVGPVPSLTIYAHDDSVSTAFTIGALRTIGDVSIRGGSEPLSADAATIVSHITPVNDAPFIADGVLADAAEDSASHVGQSVADIFGTALSDIEDGVIGVAISNDATAGEGRWEYSTNGTDWHPTATVSESQALLLSVSTNLRFVPAPDYFGVVPQLTAYAIDDSYGGALTADAVRADINVAIRGGNTAISAGFAGIVSNIYSVNDAPTITDTTLVSVLEDSSSHSGETIDTIISPVSADVDGTIFGIAVTADATIDEGLWQYSTDSGSNWYSSDPVSELNALVLEKDSRLRFLPAADYNGAVPDLTVVAIDNSYTESATVGVARVSKDVTARGGDTAFSANSAVISSSVIPENDSPVIANGYLTDVAEDTILPGGETVKNIFTGVLTDVEDDVLGIAVANDATTTEGVWQYSADNGVNWYPIGAVSETASVVLELDTLLRFVPSADYHGPVPALTVYGVDGSTGGAGSPGGTYVIADVGVRGGTTAFSADAAMINSAVSAVNDAPQIADGVLADVPEDANNTLGQTVGQVFNGVLTDVEGAATGVAIAGDATVGEGVWEYSTDSVNWYAVGAVSETDALLLNNAASLRFEPALNYTGAVPVLSVYGVDATHGSTFTAGASRAEADVSVRGGSTAFSAFPAGILSNISPVNDTPEISDAVMSDITEDSTGHSGQKLSALFGSTLFDVEGAVVALAVVNDATGSEGEWQYTSDGGANWLGIGLVSQADALVLDLATEVRFVPTPDYHGGVPVLQVHAIDDTYAGGVTAGPLRAFTNVTVNGGDTAYSAATAELGGAVVSVFDPPENIGALPAIAEVDEDSATAVDLSAIVFDTRDHGGLLTLQLVSGSGGILTGRSGDPAVSVGAAGSTLQITGDQIALNSYLDSTAVTYLSSTPHLNGNNADTIAATLLYGGTGAVPLGDIAINIAAINDPPQTMDTRLTVTEDDPYRFLVSDFSFTDPHDGHALQSVEIVAIPAQGLLTFNDGLVSVGNTLTATQIDTGDLLFEADPDAFGSDYASLTYRVYDNGDTLNGGDNKSNDAIMTIDVIGTNDLPSLDVSDVTIQRGLNHIFDFSDIAANDPDVSLDQTYIRLSSVPVNGHIQLADTELFAGDEFTQAQVDAGELRYVHNGVDSANDAFALSFSDAGADSQAVVVSRIVNVTVTETHPQATGDNASVDEGDSVAIPVLANDMVADEPFDLSTVTVVNGPAYGNAVTDSAGVIHYTNNGDESSADSLVYTVADTGGDVSDSVVVTININPVNDPPLLGSFVGPAILSDEDATVEITASQLTAQIPNSDAEDNTVQVFRVNGIASGTLKIGPDEGSAAALSSINNELGGGLNAYWEPAADANGLLPAFSVRGVDSDGVTSVESAVVEVDVQPVNDVPVVDNLPATAATYIHRSPAVTIFPSIDISDIDDTQLSSAAVRVSNFLSGVDVLSITAPGPLLSDWDDVSGVLTISGIADIAVYRQALMSVAYESDITPDSSADTVRQIEVSVTDASGGLSTAEAVSVQLDIPAYPILTSTPDASIRVYVEDDAPLQFVPAIAINSVDGRNITGATIRIDNYHSDQDLLSIVETAAITSVWDVATGTLTLTGDEPASVWQDTLRSLSFVNTSNDPAAATRSIEITAVSSSGLSSPLDMLVDVVVRNDAPTAGNASTSLDSTVPYVFDLADFNFSDPVESHGLLAVRIETVPVDGQLLYQETPIHSGHEVLAADIANGELRYIAVPQSDNVLIRNIEFRVRDDGGTADGGEDLSHATANLELVVLPGELPDPPIDDVLLPYQVAENSPSGTIVGQLNALPVDPQFDHIADGDFAGAATPQPGFNRYAADNSYYGDSMGGWIVASGNVDLRGASWSTGPAGGSALDLNGNTPGSITQVIATVPGAEYQLNFAMSGNFIDLQPDDTVRLEVAAGTQSSEFEFDSVPEWSKTNLLWSNESFRFTATEATTTISFQSLTTGQTGGLIADIEVLELLEFQLLSDTEHFAIDASNHVVIAANSPNYENNQAHALDVLVSGSAGTAVELIVPVDVLDRNEAPVLQVNEPARSIVGSPVVVTTDNLLATDVDQQDAAPDAISYTLLEPPVAGDLQLGSSALAIGDTFTRQDIDNGLLVYQPVVENSGADAFRFSLADGGEDGAVAMESQFEIEIRQPLTFAVANEWLMFEGGTLTLTDGHILRAGDYLPDTDLIIEIADPGEHLTLINNRSGVPVSSFTLQELNDGDIFLQHDGSEQHITDIGLDIYQRNDLSDVLLESYPVTVMAADVADAPLGADASMVTDHLTPLTISPELLQFSDGEDGDLLKGIEIVSLPSEGSVMLAGVAVNTGDIVDAQLMLSGQFGYTPDPDTRGLSTQSLQYRIVDTGTTDNGGSNRSADIYSIEFMVQSDHEPQAVPDTIVVAEGGTISSLASGSVSVSSNDVDFDTPVADLLVELTGSPLHGALQLNTDGTFTYTHDGSETRSDSFSYRVVDSQNELGTLLGSIGFVEIEVTPENDAPVAGDSENVLIAVNQTLEVALPEDLFVDTDTDDQLTFSAALSNGDPLPHWLNIDEQTGELSGVADTASVGLLEIVVTGVDSAGESAQTSFELTIEPQFDAALPDTEPAPTDFTEPSPLPSVAPALAKPATGEAGDFSTLSSSIPAETAGEETEADSAPVLYAIDSSSESEYGDTFEDTVIKHSRHRTSVSIETGQLIETGVLPSAGVVELQQLFFLPADNPSSMAKKIQQELNQIREDVATNVGRQELVIGGAISMSAGFSIGYVIWIIRGGVLLSSVLASMPAWRLIDPIPVLTEQDNDDEEDSETLQSIVEEEQKSEVPDDPDDASKSEVNAQHNGGNVG